MILFFIAIGGGIGSVCRFLLGSWIQNAVGVQFPWGTFTVNIIGSFVLGLLYGLLQQSSAAREWTALGGVGFCGGFTTFSTLNYDTVRLLQSGEYTRACGYAGGSLVVGTVSLFVGLWVATLLRR